MYNKIDRFNDVYSSYLKNNFNLKGWGFLLNWFEMINKATSYIEEHITEDIILEDIAKECNVSYYYFVKTFTMITGFTLKEYIRNRRITLASYEVSNTNRRILDIAFKYGYNSNEAFSRAFKRIHGINPSEARKDNVSTYTHFPVLKYDIPKQSIISLSYKIVKDIEYTLVGKKIYMKEISGQYEQAREKQLEFINAFKAKFPSDELLYEIHFDLSEDFTKFYFFVGYEQDKYPQNEELEVLNIKAKKAVSFMSKDAEKIIYNEWEKNGFISDLNCEIEIVIDKPKDKVDFYYIVSIY